MAELVSILVLLLCEVICLFLESEQPSLTDGASQSLLHLHHISAVHP